MGLTRQPEHVYARLCLRHAACNRPTRWCGCSYFTIHGLWPENYNATWPQYCSKQPFSAAAVVDLLPRLHHEWPSVFGKGVKFWEHEWRRHGTCATDTLPTEHDFFGAVLELHQRFDAAVCTARFSAACYCVSPSDPQKLACNPDCCGSGKS